MRINELERRRIDKKCIKKCQIDNANKLYNKRTKGRELETYRQIDN